MKSTISSDLQEALRSACDRNAVLLDGQFLCRSLGVLNPDPGTTVSESASIGDGLSLLRKERSGALMAVDGEGKLTGIMTERDVVRKVLIGDSSMLKKRISDVMTREPTAESPEISIAYALTLMSGGGFRHLPIVDAERRPIGIFTVKDLIDSIVDGYTASLLRS